MNIRNSIALYLMLFSSIINGQEYFRTFRTNGNKKATVSEWVGITSVDITYNRPKVKGREGRIWGEVVHYGFADLGFGTTQEAPWRVGSEENTTIAFSTDVTIDGKIIKAGKYGFFIAMGQEKATLIFSKYNTAWGSFYYNPKDDVLRVEVPVLKMKESKERLTFEFSEQTDTTAVVSMLWEYVKIPFTVGVDLKKEQITEYRRAVNNGGFYVYWQNMQQAAKYCLINNVNIDEGLTWAERSINDFFGESNFVTLTTYAGLLEKKGQKVKADSILAIAMPKGNIAQLTSYGLSLLALKKYKEAYTVFSSSYQKEPTNINSVYGMIKGEFGIGNKSEAIKFAEKLKEMASDTNTKALADKFIEDIKSGKNINE